MSTDYRDPELLRRLYIDEGLSCVDIGKRYGRDPKTIWVWAKRAGIPIRPRGSNTAVQFQPGQPSRFKGRSHTEEYRAKAKVRAKADGRVPYLRNGEHWLKTPGARPGMWKGGVTPERQAFYSSPEWKAVARLVWGRDKGVCRRCGSRNRRTNDQHQRWHIHHIIGFSNVATRADPENLLLLCPKCHRWVHSNLNTTKEFIG